MKRVSAEFYGDIKKADKDEACLVSTDFFMELKGDKMPIGIHHSDDQKAFKTQTVQVNEGDMLYVYSDGYADQFGGKYGKKLMTKNLKKLLVNLHYNTMPKQKELLEKAFIDWMGYEYEQIDDILLMGMRI